MSENPNPAQIHSVIEEFTNLAKWLIASIEESWKWWQYMVNKCPEIVALSQLPGTVMPRGLQPLIDRLRNRSSWDQIKGKINNDPELHKAIYNWGEFCKQRPKVETDLISLGRCISAAIVSYGWGDATAIDPFLNLETSGNNVLPIDKQKELLETARKQAVKFDLYIRATSDRKSHHTNNAIAESSFGPSVGNAPSQSPKAAGAPFSIPEEHLIGFAGIGEIMGRFNIPTSSYTAVDGRLKRFRRANIGNGKAFTENDAPARNASRYLYSVAMVYPLLKDLSGAPNEAPNKRPTE
jgi:hypothetical protein